MKKKGFTLIELLAVIIILAVIALIATPIVLNVVDNAKESARQASVSGYADTGKLAVTEYQFGHEGQTPTVDQAFIDTIKPQGDKVVCGQDGETPGVYYSNQYGMVLHGCKVGNDDKLYYFASGKIYMDKTQEPYKSIFESLKGGNTTNVKVSDVVYFNPVTNKVCTDYTEANSTTGVKTGCMKWYIYKIDGENVGLLLDHNTTATFHWSTTSLNNTNGDAVYEKLRTDTTEWTAQGIDLISANDISKITENIMWTTSDNFYYFDTNTETASDTCKSENTTGCKYGWLYDRTNADCTTYGCLNNSVGAETYGYWTKDAGASYPNRAWGINGSGGALSNFDVVITSLFGVRPVISISKSLIK